ncbi:glycerol dehydratase reactivase beta/small subunit family protein [Dendrosporobacter sp. 1207_IL3150]|uniref:glycerol dehydratase reactivase beta/small subunit family protein n=1 Tax=Dendrosporobacter sp. 1207_IL3150 TaxID=3084054 RepID=UPI002FDAD851
MQTSQELVKPSIMIWAFPHADCECKLREVQAGIEEEGVPFTLFISDETDAVRLAYQGAEQSKLGVGIGIGLEEVCIHYYKLPAERPLFVSDCSDTHEWRRFGYNAARLVKGIPFKDRQESIIPEVDEDAYQMIRDIVLRVIKEHSQAMGR